MGAQKHFHVMEFTQVSVVDGNESQIFQTLALHAVVDDVAQAVESLITRAKFFLGFLYGSSDPEAEATTFVDFNLNHSLVH